MKLLLLAICCLALCCSKSESPLASLERKLASSSSHDRLFAASALMRRCCGAEKWSDVRRDFDATACARATSLMTSTSDEAIMEGLFYASRWATAPICTKAIGPEPLIAILEGTPPWSEEIRENVAMSLSYYPPRDDIVDAFIRFIPDAPEDDLTFVMGYLARLPDERLVDLVALLAHPSAKVRELIDSALYRAARYPLVVDVSTHDPELIARARAKFQRDNPTGERPATPPEVTIRAIRWRRFACRDEPILRMLREHANRPAYSDRLQVLAAETLQGLSERCGPLPP